MNFENYYSLKNNITYDGLSANFRYSKISGIDRNENIIIKNAVFYNSLLENINIRGFKLLDSLIASKVQINNCNFNNSELVQITIKKSTSSGVPSTKIGGGLILNNTEIWDLKAENLLVYNLYTYNSIFWNLKISNSNFGYNLFKKTKLRNVKIENSKIENLSFKNNDITDFNLNNVEIKNLIFEDCKISDSSIISSRIEEIRFMNSSLKNIKWNKCKLKKEFFLHLKPPIKREYGIFQPPNEIFDYRELSETYLDLKNHFRDEGRYKDMSWAYLKEKESERLRYKEEIKELNILKKNNVTEYTEKGKFNNIFKKIRLVWLLIIENIKYYLFGYGEKPGFILIWSILIIFIFSLIYFWTNSLYSNYPNNDINNYLNYLYFSTITFATVGFGDFIPIYSISKILTMIQSLLGLFFYSLFIFSFGRRFAGR